MQRHRGAAHRQWWLTGRYRPYVPVEQSRQPRRLGNSDGICYANAVFQMLMQLEEHVQCIARSEPPRFSPIHTLRTMVRSYTDPAQEALDFAQLWLDWKTDLPEHLLRHIPNHIFSGGYPFLFTYVVLRSIQDACPFACNAMRKVQIDEPRLSYAAYMRAVLPDVLSSPHIIVKYPTLRLVVESSDDAEWMDGCMVGAAALKIVGFISGYIASHAFYVTLIGRQWVCIDDDVINEIDVATVKEIFPYSLVVLVSVRSDAIAAAASAAEADGSLDLEEEAWQTSSMFDQCSAQGSVYPPAVAREFIALAHHRVDDDVLDDFTRTQIGLPPTAAVDVRAYPNVVCHVAPHLSLLQRSFTEMCFIHHVEGRNVCTSPIRVAVAPGDAFLAVGSPNGVLSRAMTLAALRMFQNTHAVVLPPAHYGEAAFEYDAWSDRLMQRMDVNRTEREYLETQTDVRRTRRSFRKLTVVVFGPIGAPFVAAEVAHVHKMARMVDIVLVPCAEEAVRNDRLLFIYALQSMCVSYRAHPGVSVDHSRVETRTFILSKLQDHKPMKAFDETSDKLVLTNDPNYPVYFKDDYIYLPHSHMRFFTVPSCASITSARYVRHVPYTVPHAPCLCMWRQMIAYDYCSSILLRIQHAPWMIFVDLGTSVRWRGPREWVRAAQRSMKSSAGAGAVTIELQEVDDELPTSSSTPVLFTNCGLQHTPAGTTAVVVDSNRVVWYQAGSVWSRSGGDAPSRAPHCVSGAYPPGICFDVPMLTDEDDDDFALRVQVARDEVAMMFPTKYPWLNATVPEWAAASVLSPDHVLWHLDATHAQWMRLRFDASLEVEEEDVRDERPAGAIDVSADAADWPALCERTADAPGDPTWSAETMERAGKRLYRFGYQWWSFNGRCFEEEDVTCYAIPVPRSVYRSPRHLEILGTIMGQCIQYSRTKRGWFTSSAPDVFSGYERFAKHALAEGSECCVPARARVVKTEVLRKQTYVTLDDASRHHIATDFRLWTAVPAYEPFRPLADGGRRRAISDQARADQNSRRKRAFSAEG